LLGERDYTGHGLSVSFGGAATTFPVGPAALAVQTGVPLVPCMFARRSPERFVMIIGKPVMPDPSKPKGPQVQAMTQYLANEFTRYLAAAPSQWVAFHDAWPIPIHTKK
jgi:phosphatidylinositol dimannoside acyltransferase